VTATRLKTMIDKHGFCENDADDVIQEYTNILMKLLLKAPYRLQGSNAL